MMRERGVEMQTEILKALEQLAQIRDLFFSEGYAGAAKRLNETINALILDFLRACEGTDNP